MYLKAALGSERLIQSYRVVWGALSVEIVLLSLVEALLDVRTLFHNVVSVKSALVTAEIFFFICTRAPRPPAQFSKLLDCPQAPPWIQG